MSNPGRLARTRIGTVERGQGRKVESYGPRWSPLGKGDKHKPLAGENTASALPRKPRQLLLVSLHLIKLEGATLGLRRPLLYAPLLTANHARNYGYRKQPYRQTVEMPT